MGWKPFGGPVYDALGRLQTWASDDAALAQAYVATIATRESVTVPDGFAPIVRAAQIDPYGLRTRMVQVSAAGEPLAMDARVLDTMGRVAFQAIGTAPSDGPGPPQLIVRAPSYDLAGRIGSVAELETTSPAVLGEVNPTVAVRAGLNLEHVVSDEVGALARTVERTALGAPETETTDGTTSWAAVRAATTETPTSVNGAPLTWDAWGRLLAWDRLVDLEWDASGELVSIGIDDDADGDADGSETYIRDAADRALLILREWPDGHTERVQQIFDGLNLIEERTADGWRRRHLGGTGALDSSRAYSLDCSLADSMGGDCDDPPRSFGVSAVFLTDEAPTATFVLARSLNGDVIAVIDPTDGTVVESYAYGLHGELTIRSRGAADCDAEADAECYGRFGNAFFYTGAPRSPLTGLYDRRARQYSAALRMWISPDPMGFVDGWDRWMYVGGDPVNFVDPLGWGKTEDLGAGGPDESSEEARLFVASYTMDGARYTRFAHSYVVVFPAAPESFGLGPGEGIRIEAAGGLPFNTLFVDADPVDSVGEHPSAPPQVDIEIVELARISDAQIESMLALSDQLDDPPPDLGYLMYSPFAGLWGPPMTLNCHSVTRMMLDEAGAEWPDEFRGRGLRYSGWRATIP